MNLLMLPEASSTIIERKARALAEEFYGLALAGIEDGGEDYMRALVQLAAACNLSAPYDFTVRALADALGHEQAMERHFAQMFDSTKAA